MHGEFARGAVVAGRFRLEARVGEGGMGQVFRAEDLESGRTVAVKFMATAEDGLRDRFAREAQTLASLVHPAIVGYVAHGAAEGGAPFLAMEWLEGEDLARTLRGGALSVAATLALVRRVASALVLAHEQGVVHRDLKPGNIVLVGGAPAGATVVDFGIARPDGALHAITRTGAIVGTCGYMAPEQVRGVRDLDGRADLFSLGCVAFECLTGRSPFGVDAFATVLARVLLGEAPRVRELAPGVPEAVEVLVAKLLERERDARFSSAATVVEAIDALAAADAGGVSVTAPTVAARPSMRPRLQVERAPVAVVLAWPPAGDPSSDDTVSEGEGVMGAAATEALASRWSGEFVPLAGGLVLLAFAQQGALQERVRRAARASLDVHGALPGWGVALTLSMGDGGAVTALDRAAALGRVVPGEEGSSERGASGVVVDAAAAAFLGPEFVLESSGRSTLLTAHRIDRDEVRKVLGRASPCFGRDKELRFVESTLFECIDEAVARAVVLSAGPGIGKSRVRREFAARVAERGEAKLLTARADVGTANASLHLVRSWLAEALELRDVTSADRWQRVAERGLAVLERAVGSAAARLLVEFLGELVDAPPSEPSPVLIDARSNARDMRQQLQAVFRSFLRGLALSHPLVLVLEDLHWADPTSVSLLASVFPSLDDVPVLLVVTSWPEAEHAHAALWSMRNAQIVRVEPLGRRASERLARQLLGEDAEGVVVQRVAQLADGSPFLVEEIARHVGEGRSLDALPSSAVAVVQGRLEALPTELRRVLRLASVFGERFSPSGVEALGAASGEPGSLALALDRLRREELVLSPADDAEAGEAWSFRHSLVRRAAYEMLTEDDRTQAHLAAAAWLGTRSASDAAVIGEHFERGGAYEEASRCFLRAFMEQEEFGDYEALARLAARADRPDVTADLRAEALYHALFANVYLERFELVGAMLARVDSGEFAPTSSGWAALKAASLSLKIHSGIPCDPRAELEAFFACPAPMEPSVSRCFVLCLLVVSMIHVGFVHEAGRIATMLEDMTADPGTPEVMAAYRDAYVPWLRAMQDRPESLDAHRRAVRYALERASEARRIELVSPYMGFAMEFGLEAEASSLTERMGELREGVLLPFNDFVLLGLASIAAFGRVPSDCRSLLARQTNPEWKHVDLWLRAYAAASPSLAAPSDAELARTCLEELVAITEQCGPMRSHASSAFVLAAECALRAGDAARAFALLERVDGQGALLLPGTRTRFHLARVKALATLGRRDEAAADLAAARARLERFLGGLAESDREAFAALGPSKELARLEL
jgi:hypothetical protein